MDVMSLEDVKLSGMAACGGVCASLGVALAVVVGRGT
jgi:hypothetical protein